MIQSLLNPAKIKGSDMSYKHLTLEERYHIQAYKSRGYKNIEIAKQLSVHPSTIGREIQRKKFRGQVNVIVSIFLLLFPQ